MLSEQIEKMLSEQIKKEFESAYLYLEIADFYARRGYEGFCNWFHIQAREEQDHAMRFYKYLIANGAAVKFFAIQPSGKNFNNLSQPMEEAFFHEGFVTVSINKIYEQAAIEKDYRTQEFLNWFIHEQLEEEDSTQRMMERLRLIGGNPAGIFQLDCECATRKYENHSKD